MTAEQTQPHIKVVVPEPSRARPDRGSRWMVVGEAAVSVATAVLAAALGFTGPGWFALDEVLGLQQLSGSVIGLVALVVGVLGAAVAVSRARLLVARDARSGAASPAAV